MQLAACGDDDDDGGTAAEPTVVTLELTGPGKNPTMKAPKSVEGGTARITFRNSTKKEAGAQLVRIEGDHTAEEALQAGASWGEKR